MDKFPNLIIQNHKINKINKSDKYFIKNANTFIFFEKKNNLIYRLN